MKIEPRAFNAIHITTLATNITYEISDSDELGLCIVRTDHKDIQVGCIENKQLGSSFMLYLK